MHLPAGPTALLLDLAVAQQLLSLLLPGVVPHRVLPKLVLLGSGVVPVLHLGLRVHNFDVLVVVNGVLGFLLDDVLPDFRFDLFLFLKM